LAIELGILHGQGGTGEREGEEMRGLHTAFFLRWGVDWCSSNLEMLQFSDPGIHSDLEVEEEREQHDLEEKKLVW
jgi:hypothetical protein